MHFYKIIMSRDEFGDRHPRSFWRRRLRTTFCRSHYSRNEHFSRGDVLDVIDPRRFQPPQERIEYDPRPLPALWRAVAARNRRDLQNLKFCKSCKSAHLKHYLRIPRMSLVQSGADRVWPRHPGLEPEHAGRQQRSLEIRRGFANLFRHDEYILGALPAPVHDLPRTHGTERVRPR